MSRGSGPGNSRAAGASLAGPFQRAPGTNAARRSTYDRALRLLEFRARSVAELRRALLRKDEPPADIDATIARLIEQGLLNDAAFARQFARLKLTAAGASRFRVIQELARRGIARSMAEQAMDSLRETEGLDPSANLHRVAAKKWRALAGTDERTARRRLYAFLARRGFNPEAIRDAMRQLEAVVDD